MRRIGLISAVILTFLGCAADEAPSEPGPIASPAPSSGPPPAPPNVPETGATPLPVPADPQPATLQANRDRLLDTLAARGQSTRCLTWSSLTATQKGVFVTITDLLGSRSYMQDAPIGTKGRSMALDHVTSIYAIRDKASFGNGGGDNNRIWIQVDAELASALRAPKSALPEWDASTDLAGPHAPFDASSETIHGQPRGQAHFWSDDAKAKPLGRPGVETVSDPRVVEIDMDYDLFHGSNPEGTYVPGGYGRDKYAQLWSPLGTAEDPALGYAPTHCP